MILLTKNNQGVDTYQDLGDRFSVVSKQGASRHFDVLLNDLFRRDKMAESCYAIITIYVPGLEDIAIHDDDHNCICTNNGDIFLKLSPPKKNTIMTYETFKQEVWNELQEALCIDAEKTSRIIETHSQTIKGCYEREMTADEAVSLILSGNE
jgi:hypothetical protein